MNCFRLAGAAFAMLSALATTASAQTWTALNHQPSFGAGNELLLTDGRVLVQHADAKDWWTLTPDINGSYINGSWTQVASTTWGPLYYASQVMIDGRVYVQGGEYNLGSAVWDTQGAVYDPASNAWSNVNPPSGWSQMGDCGSVTFANGNIMVQDAVNSNIALLNVPSLTWTSPYSTGKADGNDEEGWTLLPNGNILTVDTKNGTVYEILNQSTGVWTSPGSVPVQLTDANSSEIGPAVLRPDGTVMYFGATAHTAIYNSTTGTWSVGPDFPKNSSGAQLDCADAPACLLPNGNVLVATSPGVFNNGTVFFEWNGSSFLSEPGTPNASGDPSYVNSMLMLPTGQVLLSDFSSNMQVYTPTGGPNSAWAPTITSVPGSVSAGSTYSISGTQFNGLSGCSAYGDDEQNETNYPLVRIVNNSSGHVFYCKTANHSTMAICTGAATVSTNFTVPATAESGASTIYVVANGIPSVGMAITVGNGTSSPTITSLSPTSATVGSSFTLTVNGTGFVSGAVVKWNGTALSTTFGSASQVTASVTSTQTATAGSYPITVVNPDGGTTNAVNFTVTSANGPTITTISPTKANVGSALTLTVNGSGFVSGAVVQFNGTALTTTFSSASKLTAKVTTTQTANTGTYPITVVNPDSSVSNSVNFNVNNPSPTLTSVTPSTVAVGSGDTTITLAGFGFVPVSSVLINGTAVSTTYVNQKKITAVVPASYFAAAGTLTVQVKNPPPGGGTSAKKTITVH